MEMCGPLQVLTHAAARYLATLIDDYSRLACVVPVMHEMVSEVTHILAVVENQSGMRFKAVCTDRGKSFSGQSCRPSSETKA